MQVPFASTPEQRARCNPLHPPVATAGFTSAVVPGGAPSDTCVEIKPAADYAIELVATFRPATIAQPAGERLVAGLQTVSSDVRIDFDRDLPLWWIASVLKTGDISPNTQIWPYTGDGDTFIMQMTGQITLTHDQHGWTIPAYDTTRYKVEIGFALGQLWAFPAYLVPAYPNYQIVVQAGAFQLVRSSGAQQIGDTVTADQQGWSMPLGYDYLLTFDSSGNGSLTRVAG